MAIFMGAASLPIAETKPVSRRAFLQRGVGSDLHQHLAEVVAA
jgi:hypothetical protein